MGQSAPRAPHLRSARNVASRGRLPFHFVDVFAVEPLTGNPVVVVECARDLTLAQYGRIAREFNQSETTFVLPAAHPDADWRLRSFTATGAEVFGAGGHNTLGASWWLAQAGKLALEDGTTRFFQEIGGRALPVTIRREGGRLVRVEMEQMPPAFGGRLEEVAPLAASLGLTSADLTMERTACQVVSTGAAHLMVPVRDSHAIDRIQPDAKALFPVLRDLGAEGCYAFSLDPREPGALAYTRFFNPTVGIAEDPATGTAAGPLAAHLVANGAATEGFMTIEQGTAMGRTSLITVEVRGTAVRISAAAIIVASGHLTV